MAVTCRFSPSSALVSPNRNREELHPLVFPQERASEERLQASSSHALISSAGQVLDGCFRGNPVAEKLNLTEALAFFEEYPAAAEEVGAVRVSQF